MATILTDGNGVALFTNLAAGNYVVDVVPPAGYQDAPDQSVTVVDGQVAAVAFSLTKIPVVGDVRVTVTDLADGSPRVGVRVDITAIIP